MKSNTFKPLMVNACITLLLMGTIACSDNSERILTRAPQNLSELGFLVAGATDQQKDIFFEKYTDTKIREISNDELIIFEVLNSDFKTLRKNFPESRIYENEFIEINNLRSKARSKNQINLKNFQTNDQPSDFDLSTCEDKSLKPIAKMDPISLNLRGQIPLEAGENIRLSARQSQPHAFIGGSLKLVWVVNSPLGSNVVKRHFADELDVNLDTMGVYEIYLIVQDQKKNCQYETVSLSVTGNTPYLGASTGHLDTQIFNQPYIKKLGLSKAHESAKGDGILIAIVDSGVNYNNPFLAPNIFINKNEIPDNNIDDDNNGHIDDIYGWDFVFDDKYPYDDLGHGSHLAGLAAAKVFGVAPNAKILPIKVGNNHGLMDLGTSLKGVIYALKMGADIINMSLGSERQIFREEIELYKMALNQDTLIVTSAGNGEPFGFGLPMGIDIDNRSFGLASVDLENILTVASVNNSDELTYYSNYGVDKVNLATYGGEDFNILAKKPYDGQLYSTYIENAQNLIFFESQGTSMATPVACGVAALVRSINPNLTAGQTARILESAGIPSNQILGKVKSGRVLTASDAVELAKTTVEFLN